MANLAGELQRWVFYIPGSTTFPTQFTDPNADVSFATFVEFGVTKLAKVDRDRGAALSSVARSLGPSPGGRIGGAVGNFSDWYVNQIFVAPTPINFGSIVSDKTITIEILSTYRSQNRVLNSINLAALGTGVSVEPGVLPHTFVPLSELRIDLIADTEGAPQFDGNAIFNFDHRTLAIRSLGRRLILFWYEPEQPLEERLTWFTEIQRVHNGNELRDSKRVTPRQVLEFVISAENEAEASSLRGLLLAYRDFNFGVPIWFERRRVTTAAAQGATVLQVSTVDVDHRVGASLMIWEPITRTFFDAEIASFTTSSITLSQPTPVAVSAFAEVVPVRFGQIVEEPTMNDAPRGILETRVLFETSDNVDLGYPDQTALAAAWTIFPIDNLPIFRDRNLLTGGSYSQTQETQFAKIDNRIGKVVLQGQNHPSFGLKPAANFLRTSAEIRRMRAFLHWLRGSWGSFYLPTFRNDLPPVVDFQLNSVNITIANVGLSTLLTVAQPRRSVMLELPDGTQYFSQIGSVTTLSSTQEQISLTNPFGGAATTVVAATARISWLELVRIEGDAATFEHERVGQAILKMQVKTIQR